MIQIVPFRTVASEGVGDYAERIAEDLLQRHGIHTTFIAATPQAPENRRRDQWETIELARRGAGELIAALSEVGDAPVLLHLSGYGYHRKGVPLWVAAALQQWRRAGGGPLRTVFHELYAKGPIWSSAFWLGWAQILGVRRIFLLSDAAIATTSVNASLLRRWGPQGPPLDLMHCFAAVGEPRGDVPLASERPARLVLFGRNSRRLMYEDHGDALARFVRANAIAEIVDIGRRDAVPPEDIAGVPVRTMGELPSHSVIAELGQARFGAVFYEADRLGKSGIFAALCANGVIPVVASDQPGGHDGIVAGTTYLPLETSSAARDLADLDALQARVRAWYAPHAIGATSDLVLRRLIHGGFSGRA